jgi:tetratricopeptide (TPR) repeat protein
MKPACPSLVAPMVLGLLLAPRLWCQQPAKVSGRSPEERIRAIQKSLSREIDRTGLKEEMPLERFLQVLSAYLPEKKQTFRLDKEAFGKDFVELAKARVELPEFPKRLSLHTALGILLSSCSPLATYRIEPDGIVITTPERSFFTLTYDVRDILDNWDAITVGARQRKDRFAFPGPDHLSGKAGPLVQKLVTSVEPKRWQSSGGAHTSVQVLNGSKLRIHAPSATHEEIEFFLDNLRGLADTAVVLRASVVEVDMPFYAEHIRPQLVHPSGAARAIVTIGGPLEARLRKQAQIIADEGVKVPDGMEATALSFHNVFTYAGSPPTAGRRPKDGFRPVQDGFTILVHAAIKPDWRIRLKLTQKVARLIEIKKTTVFDLATGKDVAVESPNVQEIQAAQAIEIDSGQALLMPLLYRPATKGRLWLLVARPTLFGQEDDSKGKTARAGQAKPASAAHTVEAKSVPADTRTLEAHIAAGRLAFRQARYGDAAREYGNALAEAKKLPATDPRFPQSLLGLAEVYLKQGRYPEADRLCLWAEPLVESIFGADHPTLARCLNLRAEAHASLGLIDSAEALARQALAIPKKQSSEDQIAVAASVETLAAIGTSHEPEGGNWPYSLTDSCLKVREKFQGKDHPDLVRCLLLLGRDGKGAHQYVERATAIVRKTHGDNHPDMAECLTAQAFLLRREQKYAEAVKTQEKAQAIWEKALGGDHPRLGLGYRNLARVAEAQQKLDAAAKYGQLARRCQFSKISDEDLCRYLPGSEWPEPWSDCWEMFASGQIAVKQREAYLCEMLRRGGKAIEAGLRRYNDELLDAWANAPGYSYERTSNLEVLTVLRRLQGKSDPVQILPSLAIPTECTFPDLPNFDVGLVNCDCEKKPVIYTEGGDYRSGRQERWRFEVRDARGDLLPLLGSPSSIGGGLSNVWLLEKGQSWDTTLRMSSFVNLEPGRYTVRILYHNRLTIADLDSTDGLIMCRSQVFPLHVKRREIKVTKDERAQVRHWLIQLNVRDKVRVLAGSYGKQAHVFIAPTSPAGKLLDLGWKAVPLLLDELARDKLEPERRAWVLALLFGITGQNDPRRDGVLGNYRDRESGWQVWGGRNGQQNAGGTGWRDDGNFEGAINVPAQRAFAAQWTRFREFIIVRE